MRSFFWNIHPCNLRNRRFISLWWFKSTQLSCFGNNCEIKIFFFQRFSEVFELRICLFFFALLELEISCSSVVTPPAHMLVREPRYRFRRLREDHFLWNKESQRREWKDKEKERDGDPKREIYSQTDYYEYQSVYEYQNDESFHLHLSLSWTLEYVSSCFVYLKSRSLLFHSFWIFLNISSISPFLSSRGDRDRET